MFITNRFVSTSDEFIFVYLTSFGLEYTEITNEAMVSECSKPKKKIRFLNNDIGGTNFTRNKNKKRQG